MDVELTELEKLEVTRVDAVTHPANGFPVLLMKGIAGPAEPEPEPESEFDREAAKSLVRDIIKAADKRGNVDEAPDIAGGTEVLAQIARLIIAEAQELEAGQAGEICDILELACAAEKIWCWRTGEEAVSTGSVMPATMLMQSAAGGWGPWTAADFAAFKAAYDAKGVWVYSADDVAKDSREFSADERRNQAGQGNALPDGSYPIPDADALRRAAILARSGHGDVAAAKRLIARRAKELGVANPLEDDGDTSKSQIASEGAPVDTVTQETGGSFAKAVEDAVTKAVAPLAKEIADLKSAKDLLAGELAKVKAMPIPGGPMMTAVTPRKTADGEDWTAKAQRARDIADSLSGDPAAADGYRQLARQFDEKAKAS